MDQVYMEFVGKLCPTLNYYLLIKYWFNVCVIYVCMFRLSILGNIIEYYVNVYMWVYAFNFLGAYPIYFCVYIQKCMVKLDKVKFSRHSKHNKSIVNYYLKFLL